MPVLNRPWLMPPHPPPKPTPVVGHQGQHSFSSEPESLGRGGPVKSKLALSGTGLSGGPFSHPHTPSLSHRVLKSAGPSGDRPTVWRSAFHLGPSKAFYVGQNLIWAVPALAAECWVLTGEPLLLIPTLYTTPGRVWGVAGVGACVTRRGLAFPFLIFLIRFQDSRNESMACCARRSVALRAARCGDVGAAGGAGLPRVIGVLGSKGVGQVPLSTNWLASFARLSLGVRGLTFRSSATNWARDRGRHGQGHGHGHGCRHNAGIHQSAEGVDEALPKQ